MPCPECRTPIADERSRCPNCGHRLSTSRWARIGTLLGANRTPIGIKLVCVVELLGAGWLAVVGINILTGQLYGVLEFGWLLGMLVLGMAAVTVVKVAGLWTRRSWGHSIAMVYYALWVFLGLFVLLASRSTGIAVLLATALFWYYVGSQRPHYVTA